MEDANEQEILVGANVRRHSDMHMSGVFPPSGKVVGFCGHAVITTSGVYCGATLEQYVPKVDPRIKVEEPPREEIPLPWEETTGDFTEAF